MAFCHRANVSFAVIRVQRPHPAFAQGFFDRESGDFAPALVDIGAGPLGIGMKDADRRYLRQATELLLAAVQFCLDALVREDVLLHSLEDQKIKYWTDDDGEHCGIDVIPGRGRDKCRDKGILHDGHDQQLDHAHKRAKHQHQPQWGAQERRKLLVLFGAYHVTHSLAVCWRTANSFTHSFIRMAMD